MLHFSATILAPPSRASSTNENCLIFLFKKITGSGWLSLGRRFGWCAVLCTSLLISRQHHKHFRCTQHNLKEGNSNSQKTIALLVHTHAAPDVLTIACISPPASPHNFNQWKSIKLFILKNYGIWLAAAKTQRCFFGLLSVVVGSWPVFLFACCLLVCALSSACVCVIFFVIIGKIFMRSLVFFLFVGPWVFIKLEQN